MGARGITAATAQSRLISILCFPSTSEWLVKVNPWCLSVNWAYYVSASVWKGRRRKEERSNRVPVFAAETNVTVSFSQTMAWHTDSALMLLFTNLTELWPKYLRRYSSQNVWKQLKLFVNFLPEILCCWLLTGVWNLILRFWNFVSLPRLPSISPSKHFLKTFSG